MASCSSNEARVLAEHRAICYGLLLVTIHWQPSHCATVHSVNFLVSLLWASFFTLVAPVQAARYDQEYLHQAMNVLPRPYVAKQYMFKAKHRTYDQLDAKSHWVVQSLAPFNLSCQITVMD